MTITKTPFPPTLAAVSGILQAEYGLSSRGVRNRDTGWSGQNPYPRPLETFEITVGAHGDCLYIDGAEIEISEWRDRGALHVIRPGHPPVAVADAQAAVALILESTGLSTMAGRRKIVGEIFDVLGEAALVDRCLPIDLRKRAEEALLIQRIGSGAVDWCIAPHEVVILGAATPAAVDEAYRILAGTVRAVLEHGHGQGQSERGDTAARVPMDAPIGPGPRVEIVRRGG